MASVTLLICATKEFNVSKPSTKLVTGHSVGGYTAAEYVSKKVAADMAGLYSVFGARSTTEKVAVRASESKSSAKAKSGR